MKRVTIILPCAGEGKRLGAKGPKELFEIYPGKKLIDYSLEHIKAFNNRVGGLLARYGYGNDINSDSL